MPPNFANSSQNIPPGNLKQRLIHKPNTSSFICSYCVLCKN